jgi:Lrp/AsnC family leucine-responsive transcriptional regulator
MKMHEDKLLDEIGVQILKMLQKNARISFSELGRIVGLSSPAVAERVRRLEESGYIKEYRAIVDQDKIGLPITAFITITPSADRQKDTDEMARSMPEVLEGYHLTGTDGIIFKVAASSVNHLESLINKMGNYGETTTSVVLSSPVSSGTIVPLFHSGNHDH